MAPASGHAGRHREMAPRQGTPDATEMAPPIETVPSQWQPAVPVGTSDGWPRGGFSACTAQGATPAASSPTRTGEPAMGATSC